MFILGLMRLESNVILNVKTFKYHLETRFKNYRLEESHSWCPIT
jgi:hypothetical protein